MPPGRPRRPRRSRARADATPTTAWQHANCQKLGSRLRRGAQRGNRQACCPAIARRGTVLGPAMNCAMALRSRVHCLSDVHGRRNRTHGERRRERPRRAPLDFAVHIRSRVIGAFWRPRQQWFLRPEDARAVGDLEPIGASPARPAKAKRAGLQPQRRVERAAPCAAQDPVEARRCPRPRRPGRRRTAASS